MAHQNNSATVDINDAGQDLLWLIDRIIAITEEENQQLGKGLPAPEPFLVEEKNRCANLLSMWMSSIATGQIQLGRGKPEFHRILGEKLAQLQQTIEENSRLLILARDAMLLRVEAIMQAALEEATPRSFQYGSAGTMQAATRKAVPIRLSVSI